MQYSASNICWVLWVWSKDH